MLRTFLVVSTVLLATLTAAAAGSGADSPWNVSFQGARGVGIAYAGVPLVHQSSLYVVKPGWSGLLFDQRAQTPQVEVGPGGVCRASTGNELFRATYTLEPLDTRRLRYRFRGELLQRIPAELEFAAGYFNANLIAARPFLAHTAAGERAGRVPVYPAGTDQQANDLAPQFESIEFDSRIGRLQLTARCDQRVLFFDARRDRQDWARAAPIFWCGLGVPPRPLTHGKAIELELLLTVDPAPAPAAAEVDSAPARIRPVADRTPAPPRWDRIVPQPRQVAATRGEYVGTGTLRWSVAAPRTEQRLEAAVRRFFQEEAAGVQSDGRWEPIEGDEARILIGSPARLDETRAPWRNSREGYRLRVLPEGIEILGTSAAGAFYGLQTLRQLLQPTQEGFRARCGTIRDWPSLAFRGAHLFTSASGKEFQRGLLAQLLGRLKFNHVVIQCEGARWDSHPEIAAPNSSPRSDLASLVRTARENYLEPIPLINGPGHAEWMFRNKQNLELCEDPATPYAYCVRNPAAQKVFRDVLEEAIQTFQARTVHVGHDEVTMRGRFPSPTCARCKGSRTTELVLENLRGLDAWLRPRGIGVQVWGDMFLAKGEAFDAAHAPGPADAAERRRGIPGGVTVVDWHYVPEREYPSLPVFARSGIPTIAATWHAPENIAGFARAAIQAGAAGLLQTTWAGHFPDEKVLQSQLHQFSAFVLAAEYAWSGRKEAPEELPYEPAAFFRRAMLGHGEKPGPQALVSLEPWSRVPRPDWLGWGAGWDLVAAPAGEVVLDGISFQVPSKRLAVLGQGMAPAGSIPAAVVEVGRPIAGLALLHAATWSGPAGVEVGRLEVEYGDGSRAAEPLIRGVNTAAWNSDAPVEHAPRVWKARSPAGTPVGLRLTRWTNPHPERVVRRLKLIGGAGEAGWVLAGLTLLGREGMTWEQ